MMRLSKIMCFLTALLLMPSCAKTAAPPAPSYAIVDLGTLGGKDCYAFALNNQSEVVGSSQTASGQTHAFFWKIGKMADLGTLPGDNSSAAFSLNCRNEIVGTSGSRAVLWNQRKIHKLPLSAGSEALAIDADGNIAGQDEKFTAFVLHNGTARKLGVPDSEAAAIADAKVAGTFLLARNKLGMSDSHAFVSHAFVWNAGHVRDLGLGDAQGANGINGSEQVVGMATVNLRLPPQLQHSEAFIWQNGKVHFLGRLPGSHGNSSATGINAAGVIVGWSHAKQGPSEALLWQNGRMINLNSCTQAPHEWMLDKAQAINDQGQILCQGHRFTRESKSRQLPVVHGGKIPEIISHSFLLTPIVKPALPLPALLPIP